MINNWVSTYKLDKNGSSSWKRFMNTFLYYSAMPDKVKGASKESMDTIGLYLGLN